MQVNPTIKENDRNHLSLKKFGPITLQIPLQNRRRVIDPLPVALPRMHAKNTTARVANTIISCLCLDPKFPKLETSDIELSEPKTTIGAKTEQKL